MQILLAIVIGAAFGAVLDRVGATNPNVIAGMLTLRRVRLMKTILLAIGTGSILMFAGQMAGFVDVAHVADTLSRQIVSFVQALRTEDLFKKPGVAETIDWAKCLLALDVIDLSPEVISDTLGAILKYQDDIAKLQGSEAARLLEEAKATLDAA